MAVSAALAVAVFLVSTFLAIDFDGTNADSKRLQFANVSLAPFEVEISANGKLLPIDVELIDSKVTGSIKKVYVKPGSIVKEGDVLAELSNIELNNKLAEAQMELKKVASERKKLQADFEMRLISQKSEYLETKLLYESSQLRLDAETNLIEQNNATVSKLAYKETKLKTKQLRELLALQEEKTKQLEKSITSQLEAEDANLEIRRQVMEIAQQNVDFLIVRAAMSGVVQKVPITVGQYLDAGTEIATIATQENLYSELAVEDLKSSQVEIGQNVNIVIGNDQIAGEISRIDPNVEAGYVTVDVMFNSELPLSAKPDLRVRGTILISELDEAVIVTKPYMANPYSTASVYKVDSSGKFAEKTLVNFGVSSYDRIQVLNGLAPGDEIIISDGSILGKSDKIYFE